MILGPMSSIDIIVFCLLLAPQLVLQAGLFDTVACILNCLPFLLLQLPYEFIRDQVFARSADVSPFTRQASMFEDFVIRCVRFAFANMPARIGRVFLSKEVSLPFLRYRMLRHGYLRPPVHWREHRGRGFNGIWVAADPTKRPDVVVYYIHGGGFSMGSGNFYLEFLVTWHTLLRESGFQNPSMFILEYTLVPKACYPKPLEEAIRGYEYAVSMAGQASNVVVAGDSAGGSLSLSLMLHLGRQDSSEKTDVPDQTAQQQKPGMVVLISPWVTLITDENKTTSSDFLNAEALRTYGLQYIGAADMHDPLVSPGCCHDADWWRRASPLEEVFIINGEEEVFAPDARRLKKMLQDFGITARSHEEPSAIHAWPVVSIFLVSDKEKRLKGIRLIVDEIRGRMLQDNIVKT
ncbi:hypothetical protein PoMZ_08484 [Pyricularia oryzae]|uniref:Alpha/beta hydrolase fold-3 domain-containing protein n=1 Tax=Pyricularia oryzae TaxID=318829 RepID=A0A4P7NHS4_PYROR|nr:hypothetical protein PoMZ_08484 [Pyricularia oryzae]